MEELEEFTHILALIGDFSLGLAPRLWTMEVPLTTRFSSESPGKSGAHFNHNILFQHNRIEFIASFNFVLNPTKIKSVSDCDTFL